MIIFRSFTLVIFALVTFPTLLISKEKNRVVLDSSTGISDKHIITLKNLFPKRHVGTRFSFSKADMDRIIFFLHSLNYDISVRIKNISMLNHYGYKREFFDQSKIIYKPKYASFNRDQLYKLFSSAIYYDFSMGSLQSTGLRLDFALSNSLGFFALQAPDGKTLYTRNGSFKLDSSRAIVSSNGYLLQPFIVLPEDGLLETLLVSENGDLYITKVGSSTPIKFGKIPVYHFNNLYALKPTSQCICFVAESNAKIFKGTPGLNGLGTILQSFLEMSNVNYNDEFSELMYQIKTQNLIIQMIQRLDKNFLYDNRLPTSDKFIR